MPAILGIPEFEAALEAVVLKVGEGAKVGIAEGAKDAVEDIRANIEGPPRWKQGVNSPRSGGPGVLTGALRAGLHYRAVKPTGPGVYYTEIRANRIYAARTDERYPFFARGVSSAEHAIEAKFERNIAAALEL